MLGAGGMGEVYKARDTRLDRLVAIKVLTPDLADSAQARDRFEIEARAISKLSHPNICAIFDVGREGERSYLVLELLEGKPLTALIARGPMPVASILAIGSEIAAALASAHRSGIVHRDLKPGNVLVTASGVKLLDFGLAKTVPSTDTNGASTIAALTAPGTFLGTAPYMSPEQIDGRQVDGRSDIFALGAVLYEMSTGHRAFAGNTSSAVFAGILHGEPPPISSIVKDASPALERLVQTCLEKDPDRRWQSAHDVALQLASIAPGGVSAVTHQSPSRRWTQPLGWAVAAVALIVAGVPYVTRRTEVVPPERIALQIAPPANSTFMVDVEAVRFAVSPDGRQLAFIAPDAGVARIWMRPLSSVESTPIAGSDGALSVFWSPDGRSIGFVAGKAMKRLDLATGTAITICEVPTAIGLSATWSPDGSVLFSSVEGPAIFRVPSAGGTPVAEIKLDVANDEVRLAFPSFLPDGRRFLYLRKHRDGSNTLMLGESGKPPQVVAGAESNAQYVEPGTLVFARGGALVGQPFDLASGRLHGEPFPIAESVRFFISTALADFSASPSGPVVYQAHRSRARIAWVDRGGRELSKLGPSADYSTIRISDHGRSALLSRALPATGAFDVWSFDVARGTETRLTQDDAVTEFGAIASPDNQLMFFGVARGGPPRLVRRDLRTGRDELMTPAGSHLQEAEDITPDGRLLVYAERTMGGFFNLWTLPVRGTSAPSRLRQSQSNEENLRFAPDGQHYSFISNASGRNEVYVARLGEDAKTMVSAGGGSFARWSAGGRELYYLSQDGRLMTVPVRTGSALTFGAPATLFGVGSRRWIDFDVDQDGQRFLALIPEVLLREQPLTALQHWNPTP
jgi:Tol biopolymer transport system component